MNLPLAQPINVGHILKNHVFYQVPEYKTCFINKATNAFNDLTVSQKVAIGIGVIGLIYFLTKIQKKTITLKSNYIYL